MPTAVYLLRNIWSEANYKVGVASVIQRRQWQVEEAYGVAPVLVGSAWFPTRKDAQRAESTWHKYLAEFRSDDHGGKEWFTLPSHKVRQLVEWLKLSPNEAYLKLLIKANRLSVAEAKQITTKLLNAIPYGRREVSTTARTRK